jgi:ADP-ribose pyrophosphatase YjhB (NUDIX family)
MKSPLLGKCLYYVIWPIVWFYSPLRLRASAAILVGDEILLVKNWLGSQVYILPGGGKNVSESVKAATTREIKEELGLNIPEAFLEQLTSEPITQSHRGIITRFHLCAIKLDKKPDIALDKEIVAADWVHIDSLPNTPELNLTKKKLQKNGII